MAAKRNDLVEIDQCIHCGRPESDHCYFVSAKVPAGCKCDYRSWDETPGPICASYVGDGTTNCENCEHNKECHK